MAQHPITPPPGLVDNWNREFYGTSGAMTTPNELHIARRAAQWGADQELEACCELTRDNDGYDAALALRADRRPKPTSLKEQSIALLDLIQGNKDCWQLEDLDVVRRALEQLDD